ncbi:MAG: hypothetical protein ACJ76S_09405 [Solirubrobacteraceae bacterium]|jgi:hypothetical protein
MASSLAACGPATLHPDRGRRGFRDPASNISGRYFGYLTWDGD